MATLTSLRQESSARARRILGTDALYDSRQGCICIYIYIYIYILLVFFLLYFVIINRNSITGFICQKCLEMFKVIHNEKFEKKHIQMDFFGGFLGLGFFVLIW